MTVWQFRRLHLLLLAIVLISTIERRSCAQEPGQANGGGRLAAQLQPPPPRKVNADPAGKTQPPAPGLRKAFEIAPPSQKTKATTASARKAVPLPVPALTLVEQKAPQQAPQRASPPIEANAAGSGALLAAEELKPPQTRTHNAITLTLDLPALDKPSIEEPSPREPPSHEPGPREPTAREPAPREPASSVPAPSERPRTKTGLDEPTLVEAARPTPALLDEVSLPRSPLVLPGQASDPAVPAADSTAAAPTPEALQDPQVPELTEPYWVAEVLQLSNSGKPDLLPVNFDQAIWDALAHSPYVKAVLTVPQVSAAKISEATGIFDQTPFVDSVFSDTSDPVGSTLTTGGPSRLNETQSDNGVGVRGKNALGGTAELSQNMQLRNNNSVFLSPKDQADAKMLLRLNQPLMRGAGRYYNTSSIRIAEFNAGVTQHEAMRKLQLHAQSIANAYWNLFAARAIEMQAERGTVRLVYLRDELAKRSDIDGLRSQLLRAEAAIARQASVGARAHADAAAAEASLRALVNSPNWTEVAAPLMPATPPIDEPFAIERSTELQAALAFHPDVMAARDRIKAATTRLKVAENELRPTLNLVMEGYLHGLNGNYGLGDSMMDQFSRGRPSYSGGLNYQRPYRNIVSKAILRERRLELRELLLDLDNTLLTITSDVDQAIADVEATYAELVAAVKSTMAFDEEVRYLNGRWQNAFVETTPPSLLLDELLNAQNQLIQAENGWARAQAEHMVAFAKLHVATGMLLNSAPIPFGE